jgi:hypothetical protein
MIFTLAESRAGNRQRGAVGSAQIDRLDSVADKLEESTRAMKRFAA